MALNQKQLAVLKQLYISGISYRKMSKETGVAISTICSIVKQKNWEQSKHKIETKSEQLAEQKLI